MDDDQQFCLRWNNHQSTLVSVFDTLLEKGIHVDCTLAAEGQTLKAHKVVLSACSPYFENVLSQQYDKHPIIILKDVKYAELRAMMDYMYRGEVNISQDQLAALLKAAESLQIKGLSDNKPSRPPSRPAQVAPAHPPRAPSPPPQVRDGSIDSREGSISPTRRRKKARRMSVEIPPVVQQPAEIHGNGEEPPCKEENARDGVEDLTLDEEAEEPPAVAHNDVVRNFQWHMERSQDEIMNSSDSVRDSQGAVPEDVSFTRIGGLSWDQWSARLALPLVASMRVSGPQLPPAPGEPSFTCPDCGRVYKLKSSLRNHQKWECGKEPQFQCPYCVYRAKQKMHIARHMERMHREVHMKPEQYIKQDNVDACT
ncbi:longitudinals lacking protein, isoforms A/B/D/L-like isoform X4 [Leguminivora glycinivorella]|uniref:longitudinals lacking protein, isoforms A/B/D/L-like isoform X4 n=1 Tax=Leguminivora glycinivorella TaxID=1035111 RepID=UPI00200CEC47|nr:longitudinals lacking protein, isoforms A/B/D/L-like isoform X4 [Leguminivora glycinivorella]